MAQIRWQCGLETHDIRPTLKNVADLFSRGRDIQSHTDSDIRALPALKALTSPTKIDNHQVHQLLFLAFVSNSKFQNQETCIICTLIFKIIVISGRAQIQGAKRGSSPTKSFQASTYSSSSDALTMETSVDDGFEQEIDEDDGTSSTSSESESAISNEGFTFFKKNLGYVNLKSQKF